MVIEIGKIEVASLSTPMRCGRLALLLAILGGESRSRQCADLYRQRHTDMRRYDACVLVQ